MERADIRGYLDKHCRFKLRSGKEVYGVLWEDGAAMDGSFYFSSAGERESRYIKDPRVDALSLEPEDILSIEALRDQLAS